MTVLPILIAALTLHWVPETSHSVAGLRGLSVVSEKVVWASGSKGTVLRTLDGGERWEVLKVPGREALDFRDVTAFDGQTALILASGTGAASRVYLTENGGGNWTLVLAVANEPVFFDAMKFWDRQHGILMGDPVAGHFTIFTTENGGKAWVRASGPAALAHEGAFAASGTCLTVLGRQEAWFGTGGPDGARIFHTADRGESWTVAATPMAGSTASAGIFSVRFIDAKHAIAVGGDYQKPGDAAHALVVTTDGGLTWTIPAAGTVSGYRSGMTYVRRRKLLIAVGTNGSDYSVDGGMTWTRLSDDRLNAVASDGENVWAVGPKGLILKLNFHL